MGIVAARTVLVRIGGGLLQKKTLLLVQIVMESVDGCLFGKRKKLISEVYASVTTQRISFFGERFSFSFYWEHSDEKITHESVIEI